MWTKRFSLILILTALITGDAASSIRRETTREEAVRAAHRFLRVVGLSTADPKWIKLSRSPLGLDLWEMSISGCYVAVDVASGYVFSFSNEAVYGRRRKGGIPKSRM